MKLKSIVVAVTLFVGGGMAVAEQKSADIGDYEDDYRKAREKLFWPKLYPNGGKETLYCDKEFGEREVTVEHVYAASWIVDKFGCSDRDKCTGVGDLHNLWPAIGSINSSRGNLPFGEIDKEVKRPYPKFCADYKRGIDETEKGGEILVVEPRAGAKGKFARSILYMMDEYGLPMPKPMNNDRLQKWNKADPPDAHERWRNEEIFCLQGNGNQFTSETKETTCNS